MSIERDGPVPQAAEGLVWAITTQRWLSYELDLLHEGGTLKVSRESVENLLAGAAGIAEVLAHYLGTPGVLDQVFDAPSPPPDDTSKRDRMKRLGLRVIDGGDHPDSAA